MDNLFALFVASAKGKAKEMSLGVEFIGVWPLSLSRTIKRPDRVF